MILAAEALFSASIMMSSSMRCRFTGLDVGCTTKTSMPRTLSTICTLISPSLNLADDGVPQREVHPLADLLRQCRIGVSAEYFYLLTSQFYHREPHSSRILVRGQGVEPRLKASKASVLPLDDPRIEACCTATMICLRNIKRIGVRLSLCVRCRIGRTATLV